jgi:hypothetical protein
MIDLEAAIQQLRVQQKSLNKLIGMFEDEAKGKRKPRGRPPGPIAVPRSPKAKKAK